MDPKIVVHATGDFRRLYGDLNGAESRLARLGRTAVKGAAIGLGIAGAAAIKFGIDSAKSLARIERINAQTVSAIKATGGAAGVTAKHVEDLTGALENRTATEAESIQQGANFLLTFRNIRNEAGKGNKIFDQSVVALTDMSRAMDKTGGANLDLQKGALQLGKALNDPVKGITALTRVGVSFTDQQVKTIKSLTESGDTMKAQKIILRELTKEFGGSGEAFAKTTTGKIELAKHALGTFGETITAELLPGIADLATKGVKGLEFLTDHAEDIKDVFGDVKDAVAPAVDEIIEALGHLLESGDGVSGMFNDKFLPALKLTSEVIGGLVNFVDELPGPVKDLGVEVGIAAIAFSTLTGWTSKASAALGKAGLTGAAATAETRMAALKSSVGTLAGVGGMLLLAKSTQEANHSLGILEGGAGGALLGFQVAGPWGAAIGAGAGALLALSTQTDATATSMENATPKVQSMIDSLDELTGATTAQTRAAALENLQLLDSQGKYGDVIATAQKYGISQRTLVDASLGHVGAIKKVNTAIDSQAHGMHEWVDANGNVIGSYRGLDAGAVQLRKALGLVTKQVKADKNAQRDAAQVTQDWSGKLKNFPKNARTAIRLDGVRPTQKSIAQLINQYKNIDKKDIKTVLKVTGVDASVADIKKTAAELKAADNKEARMSTRITGAVGVRGEIEKTRGVLQQLDGNRADTYIYTHHITTYETRGAGHSNVPGDPGRLLLNDPLGLNSLDSFVEAAGKTIAGKAEQTGRDIIARLLRGITGGRDDVKSALDKITDLIEKRINLKDDKKERAREKAIEKHLRGQYDALLKIGKAHDRINRKLEKAREHLAEVQQFADTIRDTLVETGNITNLIEQGRPVTAGNLIRNLQSEVDRAEKFADVIRQLTDDVGVQLNDTTLQQLLAAGPSAGLDEALALLAGGDAALAQFNDLTGQLVSTGTELGSQMSDVMYDVGLQAALGIVAGLEAQDAALDRAARRLARKLANAVRHALAGLGNKPGQQHNDRETQDALRGLTLGIDETTARRHGERLAAAMLQGFGTPKLGAQLGARGSAATVTVKLTAEQQSQLQRGKQILLDINVAQGAGVRTLAVGSP